MQLFLEDQTYYLSGILREEYELLSSGQLRYSSSWNLASQIVDGEYITMQSSAEGILSR